MAKTKTKAPVAPAMEYKTVQTPNGTFQTCTHIFNGKAFVHREMDADQFDIFGDMLIEADILSVIKADDDGSVNVNPGIVISHILKKRMIRPFLCLVLRHEDGTLVHDSEFKGSAGSYIELFTEVMTSFFTMNPALITSMQELLGSVVGLSIMGGQMLATLFSGEK